MNGHCVRHPPGAYSKFAAHAYGSHWYCPACGKWSSLAPCRPANILQRLLVPVALWLFAVWFWFTHMDKAITDREPDLVIGPADDPQTKRWHILLWRGWQLAYHEWCRSDHDRALHDHLGDNWTVILGNGWYEEIFSHRWEAMRLKLRKAFRVYYRRAEEPHRVVIEPRLLYRRRCQTLWLRMPPRREWGFHCQKGWRHNAEYIAERNYYGAKTSTVGKGCE